MSKKSAILHKRLTKAEREYLEDVRRGVEIQTAFLLTMIVGYEFGDARVRTQIRKMFGVKIPRKLSLESRTDKLVVARTHK